MWLDISTTLSRYPCNQGKHLCVYLTFRVLYVINLFSKKEYLVLAWATKITFLITTYSACSPTAESVNADTLSM